MDKSIEKLCKTIRSIKNPKIVFLNGAGISTSCGIPDFRSPGTGLYDNLSKLKLPYLELVFDIEYFQDKPQLFYTLARDIYPGKYKPSKYHYFIKFMQDQGFLQRCYTQNIDTLERLSGVSADKIIEAHGSFSGNHCIKCHNEMSVSDMAEMIEKKEIPRCDECDSYIKPDIVFFGEQLPKLFYQTWDKDVINDIDILIVCGTSLTVYPFAGLPIEVDDDVVRVLINKEIVGDFRDNKRDNDIVLLGDIDEIVMKLVEKLGMGKEFEKLVKEKDELFEKSGMKLVSLSDTISMIDNDLSDTVDKQDTDLTTIQEQLKELNLDQPRDTTS